MNKDVSQSIAPDRSQPSKPWWSTTSGVLNVAAIVLMAIAGLYAILRERPVREVVSTGQAVAPAAVVPADPAAAAPPRVVLAGPEEVSFDKYRPSTYTILGIESEPRTATHYVLRFRIRLLTRSGMDMHFSDGGFRLLIDGQPSAPDNHLNDSVPGNTAREGTLSYLVPYDAHSLALRIIHHDAIGETAELPLHFVAGGVSGTAVSGGKN